MQSTPKREITRNKYWSHRTPPEAQIFSESNISIKLFEGKGWLVYENAKTVFNFHQILCKTSCTYITFTVIKRHNPGRHRNTLRRSMNHLRNPCPSCSGAGLRGRGELCVPYWPCEEASPVWHGYVHPARMSSLTHILCAHTRAAGVALWAGCLCG